MTALEKQVVRAQRRLWLNRWLDRICWSLAGGAIVFGFIVLMQRLFSLSIPLLPVFGGVACLAFVTSVIWTWIERESRYLAAAALDEAAGLRERISSGLYCSDDSDPFARAVVYDAERIGNSITVNRHLRLGVPKPAGYAGVAMVVAALMLLVPKGYLASSQADQPVVDATQVEETRVVVKRQVEQARKMIQKNKALKEFEEEIEALDKSLSRGDLKRPEDLTHEGLKGLDRLEDALKKKREDNKYDALKETKKRMRSLQAPRDNDAPTKKLSHALSQGDFKTAKEELQKLKEQLATLKQEKDQEFVNKLSKELDKLSEQLKQAGSEQELRKEMEKAGLNEQEQDRMLENLKKKDLNQVQKQLQQKGMNQQQAQQVAKQLQQKQQACSSCKSLSKSMQQASKCNQQGQQGDSINGMSQAQQQLSEMEQIQEEMKQIESAMSGVQQAKSDINQQCPNGSQSGQGQNQCSGNKPCQSGQGQQAGGSGDQKGKGQSKGKGGMGGQGQGKGKIASEEETSVRFKIEKGKVSTTKGSIIGQFQVDGEQVKGESTAEHVEALTSAEKEASDAINRDRVPRHYQKAIKKYFSISREKAEASREGGDSGTTAKSGGSDSSKASDDDGDSKKSKSQAPKEE